MANRCQSCGKLCGLNFEEPEENGAEVSGAEVSIDVRIYRTSECCGDEIKEATFNDSQEIAVDDDTAKTCGKESGEKEGHDWEAEVTSIEGTERSEGKGRGLRSFFGYQAEIEVKCSCGKLIDTVTISDEVQASGMDELN